MAYRSDLRLAPQAPKRTHERVTAAALMNNGDGRKRFEETKLPYISVEEAIGDHHNSTLEPGTKCSSHAGANPISDVGEEGSIAIFNLITDAFLQNTFRDFAAGEAITQR